MKISKDPTWLDQAAPEAAPVAAEVEITGGMCFFFFVKPGRCVFLNEKNQLLLTVNCWFGLVGGLRF